MVRVVNETMAALRGKRLQSLRARFASAARPQWSGNWLSVCRYRWETSQDQAAKVIGTIYFRLRHWFDLGVILISVIAFYTLIEKASIGKQFSCGFLIAVLSCETIQRAYLALTGHPRGTPHFSAVKAPVQTEDL